MAATRTSPSKTASKEEGITNVQTQGVDEGSIVKVHGDHLVILRRGRLFTVEIGGNKLAPKSRLDAFAPGASSGGAWYDEMLISGNTIVVVGYSYARGGTELGLFNIGSDGSLTYRSTYHLKSNDYYSSRNYASRLVGNTLIFYSPLRLSNWADPVAGLPSYRRWRADVPQDFVRMTPATDVYRTDVPLDGEATLHTVTTCTIDSDALNCKARSVLGPSGRSFYVSGAAVYVWTVSRNLGGSGEVGPDGGAQSTLIRLPLDGAAPTAIKTSGAPIDQMSFLESADHINVLLRRDPNSDAMWRSEHGQNQALRLLRLPVRQLGDGQREAPPNAYRTLPAAVGFSYQNRYVGDWLLYGAGGAGNAAAGHQTRLVAVRYDGRSGITLLDAGHETERIEALGGHALVVGRGTASMGRNLGNSAGQADNLAFTSLRLEARSVSQESTYLLPGARQGESRTHGFFYRADGEEHGVVGLPILTSSQRGAGAKIVYLQNDALALSKLGTLDSQSAQRNDRCRASCVDWYGNSRPIFLRGRVFALMGYEIVEGAINAGEIHELRRVDAAALIDR
jgi:hypothetical protein